MADPEYISVLHGRLDALPTLNSRLVRIFISSTFTDTREERNVLLEDVYPKLKTLCKEKYGMDFQLVDMRWGVPTEANDDHQATTLCIDEIRNCQKMSTGPNFVTFLNQKHGYRPLQLTISDAEFSNLVQCLTETGHDTRIMEKWYLKDENQIPPVRVLQPISSILPGIKDQNNTDARAEWNSTFQTLRDDFKLASKLCCEKGLITEEEKHKYYMSVTEYEIITGCLGLQENAADHCLCFIRIIEDITSHLDHNKAWRFIDMVSQNSKLIDEEAQSILSQLRDEKLKQKLKDFNINRNLVRWSEKDGINRDDHNDYLLKFKQSFYDSIVAMIEKAVQKETSLIQDELYIEVSQHSNMANERCEMFHGREEILSSIEKYLTTPQVEPLVLYGQSGCGKTSIMAQAAKMVSTVSPKAAVVLRFLGTSPHSSNLWHLLKSLCQQIVICYNKVDEQVPEDFDTLKDYFHHSLKFATADKPLILLLDSLDQLSAEHNALRLNWLPRKLPTNVRIIVSTYTEALDLIGILRVFFVSSNFILVPVFSTELSAQVLKAWLTKKNRTISEDQLSLVTQVFSKCSLPLFVKLTYDQVLLWRSYTPLSLCTLTSTVQDSIEMLFSQLEKKHGQYLVARSLAYVTASKSGISETELEDLLSLDDFVLTSVFQIHVPPLRRIPPLLWVRIRHDIAQYLVDKEVDEVRSFFWYHRQFYETAHKRYLSDRETQHEIHSLMADYYMGKWYGVKKPFRYTPQQMARVGVSSPDSEADRMISAQPLLYTQDKDKQNTRYNKRKLSKLPYHLFKANRIRDLRVTCLFNYEWIHTKLAALTVQELLSDYTMAQEENSILYKALKACKTTIKKFPKTLSLEIAGRLLSLFHSKPEGYEIKLLEDSLKASKQNCRLLPYQPCYSVPSEAQVYAVEHPRIPVSTNMLGISSDSNHLAVLSNENEVLLFDLISGEMETMVSLDTDADSSYYNVMRKTPGHDLLLVGKTNQMKSNPVVIVNINNCIIEKTLMLKKQYTSLGFTDDLNMRLVGSSSRSDVNSSQTNNKYKHLFVFVVRLAADVFDADTGELVHEFDCKPDQADMFGDEGFLLLHPKQTNIYTIHSMATFEQIQQITCDETPLHMNINQHTDYCCIVMNNVPIVDLISFRKEAPYVKKATKIDLSTTVHKKLQSAEVYDGLCLITSMEGFVLWDIKSNSKKAMFIIPDNVKPKHRVLDFHGILSSDSCTLIAGYDKCLIIWDVKSGKLLNITEATRSSIQNMKLSPCEQYIVHTCGRNNSIMTWKLAALMGGSREFSPFAMKDSTRYLVLDKAGETAIVRSHNSTDFAVIDLGSGGKRCTISESYEAMEPQITSDGKYAVLREYNSDSCLKVWDLDSGNMMKSLDYTSLNLSGYKLATEIMAVITEAEGGNKTFNLCTVPGGDQLYQLPINKVHIMQIVFVMNDTYCLIGVEEQQTSGVRIYTKCVDVKTGQVICEYDKVQPRLLTMITRQSDCFLGQRNRTEGKDSPELVMLKIVTGELVVEFDHVPESTLYIGDKGVYGIDKHRFVYDIQKGKRLFQFDSDEDCGTIRIKKLVPKITSDEKHAIWMNISQKLLKVGEISSRSIIGVCPLHSEAMVMEVSAKDVILIGCEDGRVMMMQLVSDKEDTAALTNKIVNRSKRKHVLTHKSVTKAFQSKGSKNDSKTDGEGKSSKACTVL